MVPQHKIRQELFHHTNPDPGDLGVIIPYRHLESAELALDVIDYFLNNDHVISYPSKSYAVAIVYAHLLEHHFGIPFMDSLSDPLLLYGNDPHYTHYHNNPGVYDIIHQTICTRNGIQHDLLHQSPQVIATVEYFNREFFININPYFDNANLHK